MSTEAFQDYFGIGQVAAAVLEGLYEASGSIVPGVQLVVLGKKPAMCDETLRVHINHIREAMDPGAIETRRGQGYRLTIRGMAECREALYVSGPKVRQALAFESAE